MSGSTPVVTRKVSNGSAVRLINPMDWIHQHEKELIELREK